MLSLWRVQLETKVLVATLVANFNIRVDSTKHSWEAPEDIIEDTRAAMTLLHSNGVWLTARSRLGVGLCGSAC